ncbi:MAG: Stk1 family PASTA domain-containing Ser/Thr kinase [Firmicutes bacterium]|nr:Stk1 family PASTA domain-containing Ser/Thr kinase [Bacillota bacterium]
MKLQAGEIIAGRYEIDTNIGSGGMSVVYRAYDKKLDRYVTLKVLKEDYLTDDDLADRFPQEARAAAALNHQNIVSIFDFGQDGDICYIVLEYVDGATLKDLITKKAPFDDDIILAVTIQIAQGLAEAHRTGIVHRDIKPQNILITRTNIVKVTDFGIARVARSSTLPAGAGSMGSVHYSSPEQARNGYLDHKTDIYSLGVCMYEMATGRLPFDGEMEISIAMCHLNNQFPDILDFNPNVSQSVIKIIAKATEKSSSLRYQTAEDLIIDLKRAMMDDSGDFVTEEVQDTSKTRVIAPDTAKEQRESARKAFLDEEELDEDYDDYDEYDDYDDAPRSDKAAIWGGVVLAFVFMAILAVVFIFYVLPRVSAEENLRVFAPHIVGMSLDDAEAAAEDAGLRIYVYGHEYSDNLPENYVIRQIQSPRYTGLQAGGYIQVILSRGAEAVYVYTMPDLVESTLADAQAQLALLSAVVLIERQTDDYIEIDTVMSHTPDAGTQMRAGAEIVLTVSAGPDTGQEVPSESATPSEPAPPPEPPTPAEPTPVEPAPAEEPTVIEEPPTLQEPPTPAVRNAMITLDAWDAIPAGAVNVHIRITEQIDNEAPHRIFDDSNVPVDSLPRTVPVSGTGTVVFRVWSVEDGGTTERLVGEHIIDFDRE